MGGRFPRVALTWPVVVGVAIGVSLVLPAAPAAAHNSLTGSDPRNGARVAEAPSRIELRFLAKADPNTTKITVTGPDNVAALGGAPAFSGSRVSVPFKPGRAGLYIVGYQLASSDGHPVSGEVRFTLTTGTPAESPTGAGTAGPSAPASAVPPPSGAAPTSAAPGPTGAGTPGSAVPAAKESDDAAGRGWLWALGGVLLLAALAAGLLLRRRSARR
ncbi:copper resistance protein CopC [Micromonospora sp. AMSO12t]|uniref:copper resistance CopC family protein n=1 Tax=unclassified Micromonospora TaxID=2617518 RepID=UPI00124B16CE|nr:MULTISPECIES: copper resistance CopC family protein [unclassified Micromonospora]KAB1138960.1 copper resistance protein CopC [Micromonospora sp. AMSO12t]WSG01965.1 copper resistance protein CopC [Micromonospora sp. NBC_01740]